MKKGRIDLLNPTPAEELKIDKLAKQWHHKCPMCGYDLDNPMDFNQFHKYLLKNRGDTFIRALKILERHISKTVPADISLKAQCSFLWALKDVEEIQIIRGIEKYIQSGQAASGKGYSYLKAIILSDDRNKEKVKENERKRYGGNPPVEYD